MLQAMHDPALPRNADNVGLSGVLFASDICVSPMCGGILPTAGARKAGQHVTYSCFAWKQQGSAGPIVPRRPGGPAILIANYTPSDACVVVLSSGESRGWYGALHCHSAFV
jgi:hypothetical protein